MKKIQFRAVIRMTFLKRCNLSNVLKNLKFANTDNTIYLKKNLVKGEISKQCGNEDQNKSMIKERK